MRYKSFDGLRVYSAILILIMHVEANINLDIKGFWYNNVINQFSNWVFLFMIISSFSMCCGYYEKVKNKEVDYNQFYIKRFKRILPFFSVLVILDIIINHNLVAFQEGFMDLTLMFGLLPNNSITTIGVGWFLGIVFIFYAMFPFFVFLIDNKKRAWISFFVSLVINFLCINYFFTSKFVNQDFWPKRNILYCAVFFILGGILYLYKEDITKKLKKYNTFLFPAIIVLTIVYFAIPNDLFNNCKVIKNIILFGSYVVWAICYDGKILANKITKFLSNISLEIYLSHMLIFRVIEKISIGKILNNNIIEYIITCLAVTFFTIIFSLVVKKIFEKLEILKKNLNI